MNFCNPEIPGLGYNQSQDFSIGENGWVPWIQDCNP